VFDGIYDQNYKISMKKLIFQKFLKDSLRSFVVICFSFSLIVWIIQAVNYLDFVSEDGHGLYTYFSYTLYNFPKIIHRILPFSFFISLFFTISQYEANNELILYWSNGIKKIQFINIIISYSFIIFLFQIFLGSYVSPSSQDKARSFLRNSSIDFFPSLIKPGKFIDSVANLTIFIESKDEKGFYKNIFLHDQFNDINDSQIIYAKKAELVNENKKRYFKLFDGRLLDVNDKKISNIEFDNIKFDLSKYETVTTTYPKIQETNIIDLFNCLNLYYKDKVYKFKAKYLKCEKNTIKTIQEEFLKRLFKPLYILLIALITCLIIIKSKEHKRYNYFRINMFILVFFIIVFSEISIKYSGYGYNGFLSYVLIPTLLFLLIYISLITKFKNKI
jgi:lipopolysaccharide export system permease protein